MPYISFYAPKLRFNCTIHKFVKCSPLTTLYKLQFRFMSDTWDVTDRERPRVSELDIHKKVLTGSDRLNIKRNDFHQFMKGRRPLFSNHLKINLQGLLILGWCAFASYLTWKMMVPEDYSWVESERKRIKDAKEKLDKIIKLERSNSS